MLTLKEFKYLELWITKKVIDTIFEDKDILRIKVLNDPKVEALIHILNKNEYVESIKYSKSKEYSFFEVVLYDPYSN